MRALALDALLQPFVMKKHRASRLHYDFRLGFNGVLKSWAMPVGPSDCAGNGREAVQVADHRREYMNFEGVIAEGRYGSGPVMLWDIGMWRPNDEGCNVEASLHDGCLRFSLFGEKLKGGWALLRKKDGRGLASRAVWELVKELDSFARDERAGNILEEAPNSVSTGRTLEEIERDWRQGKPKREEEPTLFDL
jgi:bifunctional non-homologous end joining protein LigD